MVVEKNKHNKYRIHNKIKNPLYSNSNFFKSLKNTIFKKKVINLLETPDPHIFNLINKAYKKRLKYWNKDVKIHVVENIKNGGCFQDCKYCAQSKFNNTNNNDTDNAHEIPVEHVQFDNIKRAIKAHKKGVYRYCIVLSGGAQSQNDITLIAKEIEEIKKQCQIEICVSAGFLSKQNARILFQSGVNRYNHNLNTGPSHYNKICSTHTYYERKETLVNAKEAGMKLCSGIIIGIGESYSDIADVIQDLSLLNVASVPINFFIPVQNNKIENPEFLTPEYCLKILSVFRLSLPKAEIRIAAGRELYLKSMQGVSLYIVDSLFADGYLTVGGDSLEETKKMIENAGFRISYIEKE